MLEVCLTQPEIYNKNFNEESDYVCLLHFLSSILSNGILLQDNRGEKANIINKYICEWPIKYRTRVEKIIEELAKRYRIIKCNTIDTNIELDCKDESCDVFHSLFNNEFQALLVSKKCSENLSVAGKEIVKFNEYSISELYERMNIKTLVISDRRYDYKRLKNEIMFPIFKYAKSIKIMDRMFANHINNETCELKDNYKNGIEALINIICESNININNLSLEVYTSFYYEKSNSIQLAYIKQKITNINLFFAELCIKYNINIKCYCKDDFNSLPHDRYILTNQIGIQIGRGIDFIKYKNDYKISVMDNTISVMDNTISVLENKDKRELENYFRTLIDIV